MNAFISAALACLGPIEPDEMPFVVRAIEDLEKKGWLLGEVVAKVMWLEHVDPTIPEDVALRMMRSVDEKVALRQSVTMVDPGTV